MQATYNTIDLLNKIPNAHPQTLEVRDRIVIIFYAKKLIRKHNLLKDVQLKVKQMTQSV